MKQPRKIYAPVTDFERATSFCPLYLAWRIVDEARDYFRTSWGPSPVPRWRDMLSHPIGEELASKLARRAEAVFAHQHFWARKASPRAGAQKQFEYRRQREFILMSMRHWLAGILARERPALFRALPESFKVGLELPEKSPGGAAAPPYDKHKMVGTPRCGVRTSQRDVPTKPHFVHGCELIAV